MIKHFFTALLAIHFAVIGYYILSKHFSLPGHAASSAYANPYFPQEWEMFAPPPSVNTKLFYRYIVYAQGRTDTSGFKEVLHPLYKHQIRDVFSLSRLSYYLFNSTQNIYANYAYYLKNLPDSIKSCGTATIMDYVGRRVSRSFSHRSLLRHAAFIFAANSRGATADSVFCSYHILDEPIRPFEDRHAVQPSADETAFALNSSFYKLNYHEKR